jgi:hypothetical protein
MANLCEHGNKHLVYTVSKCFFINWAIVRFSKGTLFFGAVSWNTFLWGMRSINSTSATHISVPDKLIHLQMWRICMGWLCRHSDRLDDRNLISGRGNKFVSAPQRQNRLWGPHSLPYNGYRRLFFGGGGLSDRRVRLTSIHHVVPRGKWWSYASTPPYVFVMWSFIN